MTLIEMLPGLLMQLGFFRVLGMVIVFPVPDNLIGPAIRIGLALILSLMRVDDIDFHFQSVAVLPLTYELLLGMLLGAPLLVAYHGFRMWGDLFESLRGHQIGLIIDPLSGNEEQPLSIMISQAGFYLLISQCLFPFMLGILQLSFVQIAPETVTFFSLADVAQTIFSSLQLVLSALFGTLLPFALLAIGIEFCLALVAKVVPGLSLSSEGYLIRMAVMLTVLALQSDRLLLGFASILKSSLLKTVISPI